MIKCFKHKGLEPRITLILDAIDAAEQVNELNLPGFRLHRLKGDKRNLWSVKVSANWRITLEFENGDAHILDLEDYH